MKRFYFLPDDYSCFKNYLDEIIRMIQMFDDMDGNFVRPEHDPYFENFYYLEPSRSQFKWSRRLMELIFIRDNASIIKPASSEAIVPGHRVHYRMGNNGSTEHLLVGSYFNFCLIGATPCSHPIAGTMIGKQKGDVCEVLLTNEPEMIEILKIGREN